MNEQQEKRYFKSIEILQNEERKIVLYICSLFIALSSGALALSIDLLANENFEKIVTCIWLYQTAVLCLKLSFVAGISFVVFYLYNVKLEIIRINSVIEVGEEHSVVDGMNTKLQKLGTVSRYMFVSQALFFCVGGILLLSAISI